MRKIRYQGYDLTVKTIDKREYITLESFTKMNNGSIVEAWEAQTLYEHDNSKIPSFEYKRMVEGEIPVKVASNLTSHILKDDQRDSLYKAIDSYFKESLKISYKLSAVELERAVLFNLSYLYSKALKEVENEEEFLANILSRIKTKTSDLAGFNEALLESWQKSDQWFDDPHSVVKSCLIGLSPSP